MRPSVAAVLAVLAVAVAGACPVAISPASLAPARQGAAYRQLLTASGGVAPYVFSLGSGTLPSGVTLSPEGLLGGPPLQPGNFAFVLQARDATGCVGVASLALAVSAAPDVLAAAGAGPGNPPRVRLLGWGQAAYVTDLLAYGTTAWGAEAAGGNVDGGADGEILTGPGPGPSLGPHLRAFRRDGTPLAGASLFAFGTLGGGLRIGAGDVLGTAREVALAAPGPRPAFAPHVRAFRLDGPAPVPVAGISFVAYPGAGHGARVAAGDVDADGFSEILTGPGPGPAYPARVRGFDHDGATLRAIPRVDFPAFPSGGHGVEPASGDADGDGRAEIAAARGPSPALQADVAGFGFDGAAVLPLPGYAATPFPTRFGCRVAQGDVDPAVDDGRSELLAGPGPDPAAASSLAAYSWSGAALARLPWSPVVMPGLSHGLVVATGEAERRLRCNGDPAPCDRPYNQVAQASTHNAMSSEEDGFVLPTPNQKWSFRRQLDDGVRTLMLDTYMEQGEPALCHAHCGLGFTPWIPMLRDLDAWLAAHPGEVVTFILESYITEAETWQALADAGIAPRVYHHAAPPGSPWPTLRSLVESGQRLVVFTDDASANGDWHLDWRVYGWETPYDDPTFTCQDNRGDPLAYDQQVFILNHYTLCAYGGCEVNGAADNAFAFFRDRAARCWRHDAATNPWVQIPTFLNVDHYHVPAPGGVSPRADVFDVVRELNAAWPWPP